MNDDDDNMKLIKKNDVYMTTKFLHLFLSRFGYHSSLRGILRNFNGACFFFILFLYQNLMKKLFFIFWMQMKRENEMHLNSVCEFLIVVVDDDNETSFSIIIIIITTTTILTIPFFCIIMIMPCEY